MQINHHFAYNRVCTSKIFIKSTKRGRKLLFSNLFDIKHKAPNIFSIYIIKLNTVKCNHKLFFRFTSSKLPKRFLFTHLHLFIRTFHTFSCCILHVILQPDITFLMLATGGRKFKDTVLFFHFVGNLLYEVEI